LLSEAEGALMNAHRTVIEADLAPLAGSRFQPTGFPDLGAAEFEIPDGPGDDTIKALLVESPQSVANWLESATWDTAGEDQPAELAGLPYMRIVSADEDGAFLSSSRLEAHRLASAYVMLGKIDGIDGEIWMADRLGLAAGRPLDNRAVARACFGLDPVSLLHGVFFARKSWPWQPKIARAVTGFIEAYDARPAVSGGVKRDSVNPRVAPERATSEGYGTVPYHRVEYTAEKITAFFTIDHAQFRSYGLSESATALLEAMARYEIGTLLDTGLRLRTACDLRVVEVRGQRPDTAQAVTEIAKLIPECGDQLGDGTEVKWSRKGRKAG
jgi:CRISPR-associated protein Csb1